MAAPPSEEPAPHVRRVVSQVLAWQKFQGTERIPHRYSIDQQEKLLAQKFAKVLLRRAKAVGKERSRSQLTASELVLVNSVPGVPPHGCSAKAVFSNRRDQLETASSKVRKKPVTVNIGSGGVHSAARSKLKPLGGSGGVHSTVSAKADARILMLQVKRCYYDAIKSGRKRWESRPLFEKRMNGCFQPWKGFSLATKGRKIKFQSGPPPLLQMQVAEVRCFLCAKDMVKELGEELLPDDVNANARIKSLSKIYGAEVCNSGFLAMRLKPLDEPAAVAASSNSRVPSRSSASKAVQGLKRPAAARKSTCKQRPTQRRRLSNDGYT